MYNVIFSIDYEIHGNGDGSPMDLMVEPTYRMMKLFDKFGAKLTIMADVAEILKFKEYFETTGEDRFYYQNIDEQLKYAVQNGHDVQLHIHSGYFQSEFTDSGIKQKWAEYDLASLPYELIHRRIQTCKIFLEDLLVPVKPDYKCIAFRAANWSMSPTNNISRALADNGITIDSSVFKWGVRKGRVKFNYSNAYDKLHPWLIDENDVCLKDPQGRILEVPIYTEQRRFWSFITVIRAYRMLRARLHKHDKVKGDGMSPEPKATGGKKKSKIQKLLGPFMDNHAWKMDLNQASGKQLIKASKRIYREYKSIDYDLPIVLIGHSKSFIRYNEKTLSSFLKFTSKIRSKYTFGLFSDIDIEKYK